MYNEPIIPDSVSPNVLELDRRVTGALERAPEVRIADNFAARVLSRVPVRPLVSLTPTHYGDHAIFLGILVTLVSLFVLGLHTADRHAFDLVESFLLTQFIVLTVWLSVRWHSLS